MLSRVVCIWLSGFIFIRQHEASLGRGNCELRNFAQSARESLRGVSPWGTCNYPQWLPDVGVLNWYISAWCPPTTAYQCDGWGAALVIATSDCLYAYELLRGPAE
jgi:hypothetical protein